MFGAITFTAWSEWCNVHRAGARGNMASMPKIFCIGLTPLLQWLILPPVIVFARRTSGPVLFGRQKTRSPFAINNLTRSKKCSRK